MDDLSALRELGSHLAPDDLEPPSDLRKRVLAQATITHHPSWYRRHARTLALVGAAAATCAVIAGAAVFADRQNTGQPSTPQITQTHDQKTGNSVHDCTLFNNRAVTMQDTKDLLYLPRTGLTGPSQETPRFDFSVGDCSAPTTGATWFSLGTNGRVAKSLSVTGPDVVNPYTQGTGYATNDTKTTIDIGGGPGTLYYAADERHGRLYWTLPDGTHWHVESNGMTPTQIATASASIVINQQTVTTDVIPTGLTDNLAPPSLPPSLKAGMEAWFSFRARGEQAPARELHLSTAPTTPAAPGTGSKPVKINNATGWVQRRDSGDSGRVWISWSPGNGVQASIAVSGTQEQAIELARSVRKVATSDPRLRSKAAEAPEPSIEPTE
jgi:hypothetical protein